MDGNGEVQGKRKRARATGKRRRRSRGPHVHAHPVELRRKAVQLCGEEGFPVEQVARDLGIGLSTLGKWIRTYRTQGEAGLQAKGGGTQDEADRIRRVAVEAWLQQHQVITITQHHRVLPLFLKTTAHN